MINTAVAFIVYKRPDTTRRVFDSIRQARPPRLYLIADGPKTPDLESKCREVRQIVENGIDWYCELIPVYSNTNLGLARRVTTGLDEVFDQEESAIILEDDTLPDPSFFLYCEKLLERYSKDERIAHVSGCNLYPEAFSDQISYCFSSIVNVWGWATWKRSWKRFDLQMESWDDVDQEEILRHWCHTRKEREGARKMFDLHCRNDDPWAWSYQWIYACWSHDGLGIVPRLNLVSNLGIGPDASNTASSVSVPLFPEKLESMPFPMEHPSVQRDFAFERRYARKLKTPLVRRFQNWLMTRI